MTKYRTRPITVDASRWFKNGDHPLDYASDTQGFEDGELRTFTGAERKARDWEGAVVRYFRDPEIGGEETCPDCGIRYHEHGFIDNHYAHAVCPGDWVVTDAVGHHPVKPDIFAATYEAVEQ